MSRATLATAASACAAMVMAPMASAAGDPVASGRFDLALSPALKAGLKQEGASIKASGISIASGSINPVTGAASLKLNGSLQLRRGTTIVRFRKLGATLGSAGTLTGAAVGPRGAQKRPTTILNLKGGSVSRAGFGAEVDGIQVRLAKGGAKKLRRTLGLRVPAVDVGL